MNQAFIIMQIGNSELDQVCERVIVPALKACGLDPKRVDKHNQGGLLKNEIIKFINESEIIVADLTNERPNCYLEIGYAMGAGKLKNLILTAREDHNPDSPNHRKDGPKIHFDLAGYDILLWTPDRLEEFKNELEKRIRKRMSIIAGSHTESEFAGDKAWIESHRHQARQSLFDLVNTLIKNDATRYTSVTFPGSMEVMFSLSENKPKKSPRELFHIAREAQIPTISWPIGIVLDRDDTRPQPRVDEIVAKVSVENPYSYDYWALRSNGDFYLLQSLFEDRREPGKVFFNTRIDRVTETLLYCANLYSKFGVQRNTRASISIQHAGLSRRILSSAGLSAAVDRRLLLPERPTTENEVGEIVQTTLREIDTNLVQLVKRIVSPLFMIFDYFELSDNDYADIVNQFVAGKIT